ncbi:hypothetical protein ISN75_09985 [Dyella marensis]|uniref:hypothetical protein n=1 Tax=Dyella marensis TaxID=500610 RepID=UPI0031D7ED85
MNEQASIEKLKQAGQVTIEAVTRWREAAEMLAALDAAGQNGANIVVKIDGDRSKASIYTVVVAGPLFGESFFRKDGEDLWQLLHEAIDYYVAAARI